MRISQGQIVLPKPLAAGLLLWLIAEVAAFAFVVAIFGMAGALLLGFATSLLGFQTLRRIGRTALSGLAQIFDSQKLAVERETVWDGTIEAFGAVLLILPGFLSDFAGLALSAPSVRVWLARRLKRRSRARPAQARRDQVIDLSMQEWRRIDEAEPNLHGHS